MELFGHGCVSRVRATVDYADGAGGVEAETGCSGVLELRCGLSVALEVRTDSLDGDAYGRLLKNCRTPTIFVRKIRLPIRFDF